MSSAPAPAAGTLSVCAGLAFAPTMPQPATPNDCGSGASVRQGTVIRTNGGLNSCFSTVPDEWSVNKGCDLLRNFVIDTGSLHRSVDHRANAAANIAIAYVNDARVGVNDARVGVNDARVGVNISVVTGVCDAAAEVFYRDGSDHSSYTL